MKISSDPKSIFFNHDYEKFNVFFNNEEVPYCITANEEDGFIARYLLDENGEVVFDKETQKPARIEKFGKVKIERKLDESNQVQNS